MFDIVFILCVCVIDLLFLLWVYYECCMIRDDNESHDIINSHFNPQHKAII